MGPHSCQALELSEPQAEQQLPACYYYQVAVIGNEASGAVHSVLTAATECHGQPGHEWLCKAASQWQAAR